MSKVLMLAGDAAESLEVMYPYQRLLEEGYEVHIAGPSKKKLQFVVHDFVDGYDTYTEKPGYTWDADLAFADVDPSEYVALVVPGGRGRPTAAPHPTPPRHAAGGRRGRAPPAAAGAGGAPPRAPPLPRAPPHAAAPAAVVLVVDQVRRPRRPFTPKATPLTPPHPP